MSAPTESLKADSKSEIKKDKKDKKSTHKTIDAKKSKRNSSHSLTHKVAKDAEKVVQQTT